MNTGVQINPNPLVPSPRSREGFGMGLMPHSVTSILFYALSALLPAPDMVLHLSTWQSVCKVDVMPHLILKRQFLMSFVMILLSLHTLAMGSVGVYAASHAINVPVLMYHYISAPPPGADANRNILSVTPDHFKAQMTWLKKNGYTTITPDDLISRQPIPHKAVIITIDDGYADAYTNAYPILKTLGLTGTFFIVTDWVDQNRPGYVTWAQVKEMAQGGMSIQAHSRTHQDMKGRTEDWLKNEIVGSLDAIQSHLGTRPRFFAYPYGAFDTETVKEVKAARLAGAFTTLSGFYNASENKFELPRLRMRDTSTVLELANLVMRAG